MKEKNPKSKVSPKRKILNDVLNQILQLLHWKLDVKDLILLRDVIISKRIYHWNKKSFLGKALMYHFQNSDIQSYGNINYHHLLMAELIRNFSIATKEEYLVKCREFRIYPYTEKMIKPNLRGSNMSFEEVMDTMEQAFKMTAKNVEDEKRAEIENALNQKYPICSFDDLLGKVKFN